MSSQLSEQDGIDQDGRKKKRKSKEKAGGAEPMDGHLDLIRPYGIRGFRHPLFNVADAEWYSFSVHCAPVDRDTGKRGDDD